MNNNKAMIAQWKEGCLQIKGLWFEFLRRHVSTYF